MANQPFVGAIGDFARFDLKNSVIAGIQAGGAGTGKMLVDLARLLGEGPTRQARRQAHQTLAEEAQKSVKRSYAQTVTRHKRVPSYRQGDRYSGGVLLRALGSPRMFRVDAVGIDFIDVEFLDGEAAQWARLNAGAAPAGQGSRARFEVRFSGLVVASLGLDMVPSAGFRIPRGYWWDPTSNEPVSPGETPAQFYLGGTGPRGGASRFLRGSERRRVNFQEPRVTGGIRARNFLDAGVRTIARDLGPTYERMYRDLHERGLARVRPQRIRVDQSRRGVQTTL